MLATRESSDLARKLISETIQKQGVTEDELTIHSDRGPSMASHNVAQLLATLGVTKSHSRPHVSNDNPFSENQFKTYEILSLPSRQRFRLPESTALSFLSRAFFDWYNNEHYHSGISLLTPASLHYGEAKGIIEQRERVLEAAYRKHPERFVKGRPKAGSVPEAVWINPPAKTKEETALLIPTANCPEKAKIAPPQNGCENGMTDMKIEEIEGMQMAANLHKIQQGSCLIIVDTLRYASKASSKVTQALVNQAKMEAADFETGITVSSPGFYGPSSRFIEGFRNTIPDIKNQLAQLNVEGHRVINMEMESSLLFHLCSSIGYRAGTICPMISNPNSSDEIVDYETVIEEAITIGLNAMFELGGEQND